jgi:hypothetical protein
MLQRMDGTEHYHCARCDWFGDEPLERIERDVVEFWGERCTRDLVIVSCPKCGAEELDEVAPCCECGERPATRDEWCEECSAAGIADGSIILLEEPACSP